MKVVLRTEVKTTRKLEERNKIVWGGAFLFPSISLSPPMAAAKKYERIGETVFARVDKVVCFIFVITLVLD
jgi:hypothetical protein